MARNFHREFSMGRAAAIKDKAGPTTLAILFPHPSSPISSLYFPSKSLQPHLHPSTHRLSHAFSRISDCFRLRGGSVIVSHHQVCPGLFTLPPPSSTSPPKLEQKPLEEVAGFQSTVVVCSRCLSERGWWRRGRGRRQVFLDALDRWLGR